MGWSNVSFNSSSGAGSLDCIHRIQTLAFVSHGVFDRWVGAIMITSLYMNDYETSGGFEV